MRDKSGRFIKRFERGHGWWVGADEIIFDGRNL
jgi:hypothetical protein